MSDEINQEQLDENELTRLAEILVDSYFESINAETDGQSRTTTN